MNIDFHYGVINVIAQRAGFSPEDAQVISYASQYTDDCTFYEDLPVEYPTPGSDASTIYDDWNVHMENFFPMWKQKHFVVTIFAKRAPTPHSIPSAPHTKT